MSQFPILPSNVKEAIDAETLTVSSASSGSCKKKFYVLNCQSARAACELFTKNKQFEYVVAQGVGTTQAIVMKLRDVTASMDNGGKLWIVDLSYSSSVDSKVHYLRNQDPFKAYWGWEHVKEEVDIPFFFIKFVASPTKENSDTPAPLIPVVAVAKRKVTERRVRRVYTLRCEIQDTRMLDVINDQTNKLHKIGAYWYRFIGADINQDTTNPTAFTITYRWEIDKGTRITATNARPIWESYGTTFTGNRAYPDTAWKGSWILVPNQVGIGEEVKQPDPTADPPPSDEGGQRTQGTYIVRYPYEVSDVVGYTKGTVNIGSLDDLMTLATQAPTVTRILPYDFDEDGWKKLPFIGPIDGKTKRIW